MMGGEMDFSNLEVKDCHFNKPWVGHNNLSCLLILTFLVQ